MPKRIRFSEGVSRRDGAPLEAPYDLTDARVADATGIDAALMPRHPASDVPGQPAENERPIRQGGAWTAARAAARDGKTLYVTGPQGATPSYKTYIGRRGTADTRIPQITQVTARSAGAAVDPGTVDAFVPEEWPRYIYYLLIPINDGGEAGPFFYTGAKVEQEGSLPSLRIQGNDFLRWIAVYRTPLIYEGASEVPPGAQSFYSAERIGAGGGGVGGDSTRRYYTDIPTGSPNIEFFFNFYINQGSTDRVYLSTSTRAEGDNRVRPESLTGSPVGWTIQFYDLKEDNIGGDPSITEGQAYTVSSTGTDQEGDHFLTFEDDGGTVQTFNPEIMFGFLGGFLVGSGARVDLTPPAGSGTTEVTAIFQDDKRWYVDVGDDQGGDFTPTGSPLDRPFNTFAAASVSASENADGNLQVSQSGGVQRPRGDALYYSGGLMYMAAPEWSTKTPHPMYVEKDTSNGFDVRLQYEYSLAEGEVLGPPLELSDVAKLSVAWQGAEQACNVYVKGGTPAYKIRGAYIGTQSMTIADAPSYFQNQIEDGDKVALQEGGTSGRVEVRDVSVSAPDVTLDLPVNGFSDAVTVSVSEETTLSAGTDSVGSSEIEVDDPSGDLASLAGGTLTVKEFSSEDDTEVGTQLSAGIDSEVPGIDPIDVPGDSVDTPDGPDPGVPVRVYTTVSATHDGGAGTTTFTVPGETGSHPENAAAVLKKTEQVDSIATTGTRLIVQDPESQLSVLSSGDTIEVEGGPNEGTWTLSGAAEPDVPKEALTTLPLQSLDSNIVDGDVLSGAGTPEWSLYRRVTLGPYGLFTRSGSTFAFSKSAYTEGQTQGRADNVSAYSERIREADAVFMSNTERPLEITFDQFGVPEGETVRALFRARLSEEEGLQAYDFYVGTASSIYVANPSPEERVVSVRPLTTAFGMGRGAQGLPVYAILTDGAVVKGTNGFLHLLAGRRAQRLFADGQVPWRDVRGLAYDRERGDLMIATDEGVWGFDLQREGLTRHHSIGASQLVWDDRRGAVLAYDESADGGSGAWRTLPQQGLVVESIDTTNDVVTVQGDQTGVLARLSTGDYVELPDIGAFPFGSATLNANGNTEVALGASIDQTGARVLQVREPEAVAQTQPLTHGSDEIELGAVQGDYKKGGYDPASKSTYATLRQTRRHGGREAEVPFPRGYAVYPPLRGEGLQLEVEGFDHLNELSIEGISPAD